MAWLEIFHFFLNENFFCIKKPQRENENLSQSFLNLVTNKSLFELLNVGYHYHIGTILLVL